MKPDSISEKPLLLLLPGMDGTGKLFDPVIGALGDAFEILSVNYPLDEPLGYEELLNLVTSRIPREKPYFILGESFSGPLAVMAAAKHSGNLLGIIFVATFVINPMPRWINRFKRYLGTPILDLRPRKFMNERLMGKKCDANTRSWIHKTMPYLKRNVLAARIESVLGVNVREELKNLKVPVLYIAGADDWLIGKKCIDVIWLCRPDVEVKVLDGGHMILQSRPVESAAVIKDFCGRLWSAKCKVQSAEGKTS